MNRRQKRRKRRFLTNPKLIPISRVPYAWICGLAPGNIVYVACVVGICSGIAASKSGYKILVPVAIVVVPNVIGNLR